MCTFIDALPAKVQPQLEKVFFFKSKMPLRKWLMLIYWWVWQYPVTDAAHEAEVGRNTAIDVYQWLRETCMNRLQRNPITLVGLVVLCM